MIECIITKQSFSIKLKLVTDLSLTEMPYQAIEAIGNLLFAARGSSIDLIDTKNATILSTWTCPPTHSQNHHIASEVESGEGSFNNLGEKNENSPPVKKRKLSSEKNNLSDKNLKEAEVLESTDGKNKGDAYHVESPTVSILTSTLSGKHIIIVTGEDKSIRVLEKVGEDQSQKLVQLSQRVMPKRPCALALSDDEMTIVSADKFGDIYSLPLLHVPSTQPALQDSEQNLKNFKPAANEFTIHSERNKRALESQRKQKIQSSKKHGLSFDHKLLLGHVSMLTDVKLATVCGRSYVITSDRDEHIRVSRGIPQTHVIENFCLGHSEFVSKLCIPSTRPTYLISGGGDDEIFLWDWRRGDLLSKTNLREHVSNVRRKFSSGEVQSETLDSRLKFAVSGILHLNEVVNNQSPDLIIISCEGLPALFTFIFSPENTLQYSETLWTAGNVLDMSVTLHQGTRSRTLLVSIDDCHEPGSTSELRKDDFSNVMPLHQFTVHGGNLKGSPLEIQMPNDVKSHIDFGKVSDLLYGIEHLRKWGDTPQNT
ncbi:tRNA -methyltransferase non-catalytic subunit trm82 [Golovinomyces cichoracearum]|uniref:tRNA-methyltransferase non-catalytic subunit trm82 n=1 Tax=Golovinomyces cichoracearum TaxID=62708 RepID=A0A420JBB9_9PEZI|nr:tRNA -methyltransferase non-catalytic subunit trm82 [Golovinomyces cichoracearum]